MKPLPLLFALTIAIPVALQAQSKTTEALQRKYPDALNLFFYHNTLRMINQQESEEFDALIRDIEKMRFLMIRKSQNAFKGDAYVQLLDAYRAEKFESIMTARHDGRTFDVYLKEEDGKTEGMLVLANDDENLWILDILGSIAPDKVGSFLSTLNESTDIGQKISGFLHENAAHNDDGMK